MVVLMLESAIVLDGAIFIHQLVVVHLNYLFSDQRALHKEALHLERGVDDIKLGY